MKVRIFLFLFLSLILFYAQPQSRSHAAGNKFRQSNDSLIKIGVNKKWPVRIADSFINRHPASEIYDSTYCGRWTEGQGTLLEALRQLWFSTHESKYLTYIKSNIDMFIGADGSIRTYNYNDFNLENINTGRQLLFLYSQTKEKKYRMAADTLMKQLKNQPRTKCGGFWNKTIYPGQMRLESLYMYAPFYAWYSKMFRHAKNFDDIAGQFIQLKATDSSAREMGSYLMALADVLDYFPKNHPKRRELIKIFRDLSEALIVVRDENSSLWYQAIGKDAINGNYPEASSNCMIAYAFAKGANKGYLSRKYLNFAKETFYGVTGKFTTLGEAGCIDLHQTSGENVLKGLGAFLMSAIELEKAKMLSEENLLPAKSKITKF